MTCYEYILIYVNDILVLSVKQESIIKTIGGTYKLKEGSVMKPTNYLGAIIKEHYLLDCPSQPVWSMSANKYCRNFII